MIAPLDSTPKRAFTLAAAAIVVWAVVRKLTPMPTGVARSAITVFGSLLEVETRFLEQAANVAFEFTPRHSEVEVRAVSSVLDAFELRSLLRQTKQMIEAGEVARSDSRVHGPRSRRERRAQS